MASGYGVSPYGIVPYGFGTTPYPIGTPKLVIPYNAAFDNNDTTVCFEVWIDPTTSVDTALLCHGGGSTTPAWYIGYVGTSIKAAISDTGGASVDASIPASGYEYRWLPITIGIERSGANTYYEFSIDNDVVLTGSFAGDHYVSTDDVVSGMGGRIRNIRMLNWSDLDSGSDLARQYYEDKFLSYYDIVTKLVQIGSYAVNDNSMAVGGIIDESSLGNDGTLLVGSWIGGSNDLTVVGAPTWTSTTGIGRRDTSLLNFMRDVQVENPGSIIVEQELDDANRTDIFDGDEANPVTAITDDAGGVIVTFEQPFLKGRRNEIELNRDITVLGGGTITEGTSYTWTLPSSTDLGYEVTGIEAGINSFKVSFNTTIKEGNGKVSGVDPAMMQWLPAGVIIYTDDTGSRTVTLSEFTDMSGNIIPSHTENVTVLEEAVRFDYQGMQMIQSRSYKDGYESKISREAKNYISEKLREKRGDL